MRLKSNKKIFLILKHQKWQKDFVGSPVNIDDAIEVNPNNLNDIDLTDATRVERIETIVEQCDRSQAGHSELSQA